MHKESELVEHQTRVLLLLESINSDVKDAVMMQRGFLLTGEKSFIKIYSNAKKHTEERLNNLDKILNEPEIKQLHLDSLKKMIDRQFVTLEETMNQKKINVDDSLHLKNLILQGKVEMDKIRLHISQLKDIESLLIEDLKRNYNRWVIYGYILLGVSTIVSILIVLSAFLSLKNEYYEKNQSEKKYRDLFEQSTDVLFLTNNELKFMDVNPAACTLFQYSRDELLQMSVTDLIASPRLTKQFKETIEKDEKINSWEIDIRPSNGGKLRVLISLEKQPKGDGAFRGFIHSLSDQFISSQNRQQSDKVTATGRMARLIAHEVRNPLTNINLALEQLKNEPHNSENNEMMLEIIERNAVRINTLITQLLDSTKFSELKKHVYSVIQLVEESLDLASDRIKIQNIEVIKQYHLPSSQVEVDVEKMKIALLNIIINAVEAMENENGILVITTKSKNNKTEIYISDNGAGITPENISKLFEPFYTNKSKGIGLGLTASQSIVISHNGNLRVESSPDEGTTFIISLEEEQAYASQAL